MEFFCKEDSVLYCHLCVYSVAYLYLQGFVYLFYSLHYNPILGYWGCCLSHSSWGHWKLFRIDSCVPLAWFHSFELFLCASLLSGTIKCSRLILYFPSIALVESAISTSSPGSFCWKVVFRNKNRGSWFACCYWVTIASNTSQQTKLEKICLCAHTTKNVSVSVHLCLY